MINIILRYVCIAVYVLINSQPALFINLIRFITGSFVYFSQSQYWVYENYGSVQLNLLFYYKVSVNLNITVMSNDITAEGIYMECHNYDAKRL